MFNREPAAIMAVIQAGIALAIGFGLHWTGEQVALVMAFSAAVLGLITRSVVTPVASPILPIGTPVETPAGASAVVSGAAPR